MNEGPGIIAAGGFIYGMFPRFDVFLFLLASGQRRAPCRSNLGASVRMDLIQSLLRIVAGLTAVHSPLQLWKPQYSSGHCPLHTAVSGSKNYAYQLISLLMSFNNVADGRGFPLRPCDSLSIKPPSAMHFPLFPSPG
jgi:hypothetical protein